MQKMNYWKQYEMERCDVCIYYIDMDGEEIK